MNAWETLFASVFVGVLIGLTFWIVLLAVNFDFSFFKRLFKRKPKYKVGQKVRVIRGLKYAEYYGRKDDKLKVWARMMKSVGNVVTIVEVYNNGLHFNILEDDANDVWHANMFERINIKKADAFEALLYGHINDEEYTVIMKKRGRRC